MPISNASSGFRPGVCTSTTRPVSPFNGQVIYETDTKQTLVWQGTTWVMLTDADTPPGMQLINSTTISNGVSSVSINDVFSTEFLRYKVFIKVDGSVSSYARLRMRVSGADNSSSNYYRYGSFQAYNGSLVGYGGGPENAFQAVGEWVSGFPSTCSMEIFDPFVTTRTMFSCHTNLPASGAGYFLQGTMDVTTSYTGFTVFPNSGTFTSGVIKVYGFRD